MFNFKICWITASFNFPQWTNILILISLEQSFVFIKCQQNIRPTDDHFVIFRSAYYTLLYFKPFEVETKITSFLLMMSANGPLYCLCRIYSEKCFQRGHTNTFFLLFYFISLHSMHFFHCFVVRSSSITSQFLLCLSLHSPKSNSIY